MAKLSSLRASDSDREQVAERLRCATAEGRLTADELEERLEVLSALLWRELRAHPAVAAGFIETDRRGQP